MSNNKTQIEFTDRYGSDGPPSWLRGCLSGCDATGHVPIYKEKSGTVLDLVFSRKNMKKVYDQLWEEAEKEKPTDDGWHFVCCPACQGTGLVSWFETMKRIPRWIVRGVSFMIHAPNMNGKLTFADIWLKFKCAFLSDLGLWKP